MDRNIISQLAEKLYSLFIVNTKAAGIQQKDGRYLTKYFPLTPFVLETMLLKSASMGCYQQMYKSGSIRWICFDFDCKDKENPDVEMLYRKIARPLTEQLDRWGIRYLTEFSGRRGIHVWIIFNRILSKKMGFRILNEIYGKFVQAHGESDDALWGLDKFPATGSFGKNIVGKLVKIPLSCHTAGSMSYFFTDGKVLRDDVGTDAFFAEQLDILKRYEENELGDVIRTLNMHMPAEAGFQYQYKPYRTLAKIEEPSEKVCEILSETSVFERIFERMKKGRPRRQDWTVLLGTLSLCDPDAELLRAVLQKFPCYDEEETVRNLNTLKSRYYPATFGYLYQIYDMSPEEGINLNETGFSYLVKALGISDLIQEESIAWSERKTVLSLEDTITKEKNYFQYNDEVPDAAIWNDLNALNAVDCYVLSKTVESILRSWEEADSFPTGFRVCERLEKTETSIKKRKLVSLSAKDRVLTSHLALRLCMEIKHRWKSFSYHPALTSRQDLFFQWYRSWKKYVKQLKAFVEIPFFQDYKVIFIDLKSFYDSVDILTVYRTLMNRLPNEETKNAFCYLIAFNDRLMDQINGNRAGLPQGPAYARIIAELFLDEVLDKILPKRDSIQLFRYVDDIVIFCAPEEDADVLLRSLKNGFRRYYLSVNEEKSFHEDRLDALDECDRERLLHTNSFHYDLKQNAYTGVLSPSSRAGAVKKYFHEREFNIDELGYIYGTNTLEEARTQYYERHKTDIFQSVFGRGSAFRSFYQFLFSHPKALSDALDSNLFFLIPYPSLSFSVFLHTLYLSVQQGNMGKEQFLQLQRRFLRTLSPDVFDECDRRILMALQNTEMEIENGQERNE